MKQQPGVYRAQWEQFTHLSRTYDTLARERRGWRRWLLLPYVGFIIPVDDPVVRDQLLAWQADFRPHLPYDSLPPDALHITLHYAGLLRRGLVLPQTWRRPALDRLAERVCDTIESTTAFEVSIGPLNAFPNVLLAEVQDNNECLRLLRANLRRELPLRARPPTRWGYYLPHVTLGYWGDQPVAPLVDAMQSYRNVAPVPFRITRVKFTVYVRDVPLGRDVLRAAHEDLIATYHLKT
ncbi:MAG: 2'-5' RNA ligase family protein [Anaerolineae bacterium]|nr:2'-5' RNA ligase family protein [Anaerolineae bacterium]